MHLALVSIIILGAGLLGGFVRYLVTSRQSGGPKPSILCHLGLGVVAAGVVPLFLELTASRILEDSPAQQRYYFVFAGFCLLFAYSAERTLERMTSHVLQRLDALEEKADIAQETAQAAQTEAAAATVAAEATALPVVTSLNPSSEEANPPTLEQLAREYDAIRTTERGRPSNDRTRRMTVIFQRMAQQVKNAGPAFDIDAHLNAPPDQFGKRLVGFAACYELPQPANARSLITAIRNEEKPFGVYWGLRALELVCQQLQGEDRQLARDLARTMMARADLKGTDRYHVLRQIDQQLSST